MKHYQATRYCVDQGGLPTAKQLALSLNPIGVSEVAREGFARITPFGEAVFYYNYKAYQRPTGDEVSNYFWSSSLHPTSDESAFVFNGVSGDIYGVNMDNDNGAVRCMNGH